MKSNNDTKNIRCVTYIHTLDTIHTSCDTYIIHQIRYNQSDACVYIYIRYDACIHTFAHTSDAAHAFVHTCIEQMPRIQTCTYDTCNAHQIRCIITYKHQMQYAHTCIIHPYMHPYMHTCTCVDVIHNIAYIHTYIRCDAHMHTHIHQMRYIQTYIHTYIHTSDAIQLCIKGSPFVFSDDHLPATSVPCT